jgi:hypothetical protein
MDFKMNERIRELTREAQAYATRIVGEDEVNFNIWMETYEVKLAKLIVQECFEHCKGQLVDKKTAEHMGLTYNDGVMDCATGLLQHFGVEE